MSQRVRLIECYTLFPYVYHLLFPFDIFLFGTFSLLIVLFLLLVRLFIHLLFISHFLAKIILLLFSRLLPELVVSFTTSNNSIPKHSLTQILLWKNEF